MRSWTPLSAWLLLGLVPPAAAEGPAGPSGAARDDALRPAQAVVRPPSPAASPATPALPPLPGTPAVPPARPAPPPPAAPTVAAAAARATVLGGPELTSLDWA